MRDWFGKYWTKWGDALREAGYPPNRLNQPYPDDLLLERLALLARKLGHLPVSGEIRLRARDDPEFPSHNTFARFGRKADLAGKLLRFCENRGGFDDVAALCIPLAHDSQREEQDKRPDPSQELGYVYLMRSGRFYKIGKTNSVGRRERELTIQLPERAKLAHSIKTDDPAGIEKYWHERFGDRRKNGEWFELCAADVAAFRRRKFM
jgi:hypothetical protein